MDAKLLFGLAGGGIVGFIGYVLGVLNWESVCSAIPADAGSILKFDVLLRSCPVVGDMSRENLGFLTGGILGAIGLIGGVVSGQRRGATT
jgi:hypothetical protein